MKIKGPSLTVKRIYEARGIDGEFAVRNSWVINCAIYSGLAICGSVGVGIATKYPDREANDLDFVTDDKNAALLFLNNAEEFLSKKSVYYKKMVNHRTKFCPNFTVSHYRIVCPLWMEICVFVLDANKIKLDFFFRDGVRVQNYSQMYDAAKSLENRDGKPRINRAMLSDEFDTYIDKDRDSKAEQTPQSSKQAYNFNHEPNEL